MVLFWKNSPHTGDWLHLVIKYIYSRTHLRGTPLRGTLGYREVFTNPLQTSLYFIVNNFWIRGTLLRGTSGYREGNLAPLGPKWPIYYEVLKIQIKFHLFLQLAPYWITSPLFCSQLHSLCLSDISIIYVSISQYIKQLKRAVKIS